ncbi:Translocator protein-like protein [Hibiscus syriacus]|uniref:Translocator protein-like protein n=1 Tax=Hibiscus syriacus TaxID=106335 RepID=A0A6A2X7Z2_HIBSY|nr:translocator protein homolog [Hibiscus syriacus]KAE8671302.1 Translocator protein-like protein [Hibiscus syriacus]
MDSQNLRQRSRDDSGVTSAASATATTNEKSRNRREKRMEMAKRGLRSLVIAVSLPLSLTLLNIYLFGSGRGYGAQPKPFWFPPSWLLHTACLAESFLMGLSAWFVWADGGFHIRPTAFFLYTAYLGLSLAWLPTVFWMGASWAGLLVSLAMVATLLGCSRDFGKVNPIAGNLVLPCLAWAAFLVVVNLKLVFL